MSITEYIDYVSRILLKKRPLEQIVEEALDFAHVRSFQLLSIILILRNFSAMDWR